MSDGPQRLRVLVIVPAWNEQASIGDTLREIRECVPWADLLVVDDGSADRTADTAVTAGAMVCRLPFNLGVGGAMRTGYRYALRHGYDVAVQIDADGQHDPRFLVDLLEWIGDADIVIGARFAKADDSYVVRGPRRWAIALFAQHYPAEYLGDTVESLVIAARAGCRIAQQPVTMRARTAGRASHSPVKAAIYLCRAVVALLLALVRDWPAQFEDEAQALTSTAATGTDASSSVTHPEAGS